MYLDHRSWRRPQEVAGTPARPAGPEVAPECVQATVCVHGVHITSKPTPSMDSVLGGAFGIHPGRGARGNRDRGVVALGATADVGLSQDARAGFVTEPFANSLLTKSPETSPIGDRRWWRSKTAWPWTSSPRAAKTGSAATTPICAAEPEARAGSVTWGGWREGPGMRLTSVRFRWN